MDLYHMCTYCTLLHAPHNHNCPGIALQIMFPPLALPFPLSTASVHPPVADVRPSFSFEGARVPLTSLRWRTPGVCEINAPFGRASALQSSSSSNCYLAPNLMFLK